MQILKIKICLIKKLIKSKRDICNDVKHHPNDEQTHQFNYLKI